jgi:hypothetical protein
MENPMHDPHTTTPYAGKHVPFKKGGWGVALFVVLLAVASAASAAYVHKQTYKSPTDVRFHAVGSDRSHG